MHEFEEGRIVIVVPVDLFFLFFAFGVHLLLYSDYLSFKLFYDSNASFGNDLI